MLGTLIVGVVKRSLKIIDQMHRKSNARIANATKTKENMGQNVITTVICPITNSIPLFGKSKSRQCLVKTTKCSIEYYLCQNLSATEIAKLEMNRSLLNYFQNIRNYYFHYDKEQRLKKMYTYEIYQKINDKWKKKCENSQILLEIVICMLTSFRKKT